MPTKETGYDAMHKKGTLSIENIEIIPSEKNYLHNDQIEFLPPPKKNN